MRAQTATHISQPFVDPDPFQEIAFPNAVTAKRAIADYLGAPLAKLPPPEMDGSALILFLRVRVDLLINTLRARRQQN